MDALVTTNWLADALDRPELLILDASYTSTLPGSLTRDPCAAFEAGHIPGARFLDLDTLTDGDDPRPSMLPTADAFADRMRALGVTPDTRIVLYDGGPHHTACRAWWVLRMFGVEASLLDGDIAKWQREGRPLDTGTSPDAAPSAFVPAPPKSAVRDKAAMLANVDSRAEQVADARSAARFTGEDPDPRPGCGSGHIPGAANLPYESFFEADGTWKSPAAIAAIFEAAGVDPSRPLVATCGSGITAAVIAFAAHRVGGQAALYDGSWSEWGADPATPKSMGPA